MNYRIVSPSRLTATEEVDLQKVEELQAEILRTGAWTAPITVEKEALFVMDGHHRLSVAHRLGLAGVPVFLLDYSQVRVESWRPGETITPASIFAMARSGRKFPCKTTRHIFDTPLPACDVPLALLHGYGPTEAAPARAVGRRA